MNIYAVHTQGLTHGLRDIYGVYAPGNDIIKQCGVGWTQCANLFLGDQLMGLIQTSSQSLLRWPGFVLADRGDSLRVVLSYGPERSAQNRFLMQRKSCPS